MRIITAVSSTANIISLCRSYKNTGLYILIAINFISMKFYLISDFKRLREKIFEHLNNKTYTEHGIAIARNKCDKCKDTVIASVDLKNIKKNLGIDVLIIDLV